MKGTVSRGFEDSNDEKCGIGIDLFRIENTFDNSILRFFMEFYAWDLAFFSLVEIFMKKKINDGISQ